MVAMHSIGDLRWLFLSSVRDSGISFLMEKYNEENSMPPITTYAGELEAKANQDEIRMLSVQYVSTELLCSGIN